MVRRRSALRSKAETRRELSCDDGLDNVIPKLYWQEQERATSFRKPRGHHNGELRGKRLGSVELLTTYPLRHRLSFQGSTTTRGCGIHNISDKTCYINMSHGLAQLFRMVLSTSYLSIDA